jgi:alpha-mannosidase
MHDEASTHYMGMIDQTTLGHAFLKRELGVIPRVGWQLDPFGHSATQASLMTSRMGFDALYFGRIDYQDLRVRQLEQECEGLWNASNSLGDTTIFWGLTGSNQGMYGAPHGFCFDYYCEDPKLTDLNASALEASITKLLRMVRIQSDQTKGNHIMLTMGEDFQVSATCCDVSVVFAHCFT